MSAAEQELMQAERPAEKSLTTVEFNFKDAALVAMKERFKDLVISDTKSYESTKAARAEVREVRYGIQNALKAGNAELRKKIAANDTEAERLINMIVEVETPLDAEVKRWEKKKADEKAERERQEQERIDKITGMVNWMAGCVRECAGKDSAFIRQKVEELGLCDVTEEAFQEFINHATATKFESLKALGSMLADRLALEESERLRLEQEAATKAAQDDAERVKQEAQAIIDAAREKQRQDDEKRQKADQQRNDADRVVSRISTMVMDSVMETAAEVGISITTIANIVADPGLYGEHAGKVAESRADALDRLNVIRTKKQVTEANEREQAEAAQKLKDEQEAKEKAERDEQARIEQEEAERVELARLEALRPDREKLISHLQACIDSVPIMATEDGAGLKHNALKALHSIVSALSDGQQA
jgi:hypothetical protein